MIFDEKCLFFTIKADYYIFFYHFQVNIVMMYNCRQFFHGILEVENLEISLPKKKYLPLDTNTFLF
jgi:hypothetical protein